VSNRSHTKCRPGRCVLGASVCDVAGSSLVGIPANQYVRDFQREHPEEYAAAEARDREGRLAMIRMDGNWSHAFVQQYDRYDKTGCSECGGQRHYVAHDADLRDAT
jgi:hypothetical protein